MNLNLREKNISIPVTSQQAIIGTPFDPISKKAAIIYFTATYCGPCSRAIPTLKTLQEQYPNIPALAISQEPKAKLEHHYAKVKSFIPYSLCAVTDDVWETITDAIGLQGIPHCVLLYEGKVLYNDHPLKPDYQQALAKLSGLIAAQEKQHQQQQQ